MTDKITISAFQLFEMFPDEDIAKVAVEALREIREAVYGPSYGMGERIRILVHNAMLDINASGWQP